MFGWRAGQTTEVVLSVAQPQQFEINGRARVLPDADHLMIRSRRYITPGRAAPAGTNCAATDSERISLTSKTRLIFGVVEPVKNRGS